MTNKKFNRREFNKRICLAMEREIFLWDGAHSYMDARTIAKNMAKSILRKISRVAVILPRDKKQAKKP